MKHTTLTNINTFTSEEFGEIRTVTIDGEPWFVAKDISDKLGYAQTSNMMKRIDDEDFKSSILDGMNMKSILINESGVYSAILGSKLESAKRFKHWVTSEVLPSIRKNGGYVMEETNLSDNELLAKAVLLSQNIIEEKNKKIQELNTDIDYKKDVIQNFADNVPLSDQRQMLNRIIRHNYSGKFENRWKKLYKEFDNIYHVNTNYHYNKINNMGDKPMFKNKLDFMEAIGAIPDLYKIAIKLFESDVKKLVDEMYGLSKKTN